MPYPALDLCLYALDVSGPETKINGKHGGMMQLRPSQCTAWSSSFESVAERISEIERMYFEPDGSFLWAGEVEKRHWRLEGFLYDDGHRLQRCELRGRCPRENWQLLLDCLSGQHDRLVAFDNRRNVYLPLEAVARMWS